MFTDYLQLWLLCAVFVTESTQATFSVFSYRVENWVVGVQTTRKKRKGMKWTLDPLYEQHSSWVLLRTVHFLFILPKQQKAWTCDTTKSLQQIWIHPPRFFPFGRQNFYVRRKPSQTWSSALSSMRSTSSHSQRNQRHVWTGRLVTTMSGLNKMFRDIHKASWTLSIIYQHLFV